MDPFSLLLVSLLLGIFLFKGTLFAATLLLERPIRRRFAAEPAGGEALRTASGADKTTARGAINDIEQGESVRQPARVILERVAQQLRG
jgi:hypothetical protein